MKISIHVLSLEFWPQLCQICLLQYVTLDLPHLFFGNKGYAHMTRFISHVSKYTSCVKYEMNTGSMQFLSAGSHCVGQMLLITSCIGHDSDVCEVDGLGHFNMAKWLTCNDSRFVNLEYVAGSNEMF